MFENVIPTVRMGDQADWSFVGRAIRVNSRHSDEILSIEHRVQYVPSDDRPPPPPPNPKHRFKFSLWILNWNSFINFVSFILINERKFINRQLPFCSTTNKVYFLRQIYHTAHSWLLSASAAGVRGSYCLCARLLHCVSQSHLLELTYPFL